MPSLAQIGWLSYPNSHAGYYPGAKYLAMKVVFRKSDRRLLGAQVLGEDGVPKRIDSFVMAIQLGCTIYDLEEAEFSYAPPFGSAKDPVNTRILLQNGFKARNLSGGMLSRSMLVAE